MKQLLEFAKFFAITAIIATLGLTSCRQDDPVDPPIDPDLLGAGFYLLNEGMMGSNNATLDFYDYNTNKLIHNIFEARNPNETMGLGDTGNDLELYNGRLYAVINGSSYLEVIDATRAKHIAKIAIPNPRYVAFNGDFAYVTSYSTASSPYDGGDGSPAGFVAKVDLNTLKVVDQCTVGRQPDELAVVGNKLYVANSGGYADPDYETTVSVIDLTTFSEIKRIEVAPNLYRVRPDGKGKLYVSSRGDYLMNPAATFVIDTTTDAVSPTPIESENITLAGDNIYAISVTYDAEWNPTNAYLTYNITTDRMGSSFITDSTDTEIVSPYGIAIEPTTGEIFVTDAVDYFSDGKLNCYSSAGTLKWSVTAGVSPAHFAFFTPSAAR